MQNKKQENQVSNELMVLSRSQMRFDAKLKYLGRS